MSKVKIAIHAKQKQIVLSGGCFQNAYLTERCIKQLKAAGFTVYTHKRYRQMMLGLH